MRRARPQFPPMIEPLESRIAPAAIPPLYTFSDVLVNSKGQTVSQFYNAADPTLAGANLSIAAAVGKNPDVYFIKLTAGEDLKTYNTANGQSSEINVTKGTLVAFFTDSAYNSSDTIAQNSAADAVVGSDLTGLALGNKTSVAVGSGVNGDIITNYNDVTGTLGGLGESLGSATQLLTNTVTSLSVSGTISGTFAAGGNVGFFEAGQVGQVLTGTAAAGYTYHYEGPLAFTQPSSVAAGDTTLAFATPGTGVAGVSITRAVLGSVINGITLGNGGPGGAGGSIGGLDFLNDLIPATVIAGNGGAGIAGHINGGAGGSISNVVVQGLSSNVPQTPNTLLTFEAGTGGLGFGSTGRGGAGGSVSNVFVSYQAPALGDASLYSLQDDVIIDAGNGGNGSFGGAGGHLANINILTSTPHLVGSPEIQLIAGSGGTGSVGTGGAGGSITGTHINVVAGLAALLPIDPITNLPYDTTIAGAAGATSPTGTEVLIQAGHGGAGLTAGGAGGSIGISPLTGTTLEGFNFELIAGYGGTGHSGGIGGGINSVTVLGSSGTLVGDDFHVQSLVLDTGDGGAGTTLAGGRAGSLYSLNVDNADFGPNGFGGFQILTGTGGASARGAGGAGGNITLVHVTGIDFLTDANPAGSSGIATIVAGNGGNAKVLNGHGGHGGSIDNITIVATRLDVEAMIAGDGGNGGVNASTGIGGAGGTVLGVAVRVSEDMYVTADSYTSPSVGELYDSTANFEPAATMMDPNPADVAVGDFVENTTNMETSTVTSVSATTLGLQSDIFAAGDGYLVLVPGTGGGAASQYTGTAGDDPSGSQDTIIDANSHFAGVQVGDVVLDVTDTNAATLAAGGVYTPITATVTSIANVASGILNVNKDISHVGDQYAFTTLDGGTIVASPTTIIVQTATGPSSFTSENISPGILVEDVTATNANNGVPVTATVATISAQSLTVTNPTSATFGAVGDQYSFPTAPGVTIIGGSGGYGILNGAGGAGGKISDTSTVIQGPITYLGGTGGTGGTGGANGAAGSGGSLVGDGAFSTFSSGYLSAGNAGVTGAKPGVGGSISGAAIEALDNVSLVAGYGTGGGAGGSVLSSGYSGVLQDGGGFNPPAGNITVQAGAGGTSGIGVGGAGGNINNITGFISSGDGNSSDSFLTDFIAGNGGNGTSRAGTGGSINSLRFYGGGGAGVTFFVNAGDAGDTTAATGKTGAAGGSVYGIGGGVEASGSGDVNFSISPLTDFHHISAGDGGSGTVKGGTGGSVSDVYVNATIGIRTGAPFGFDIAGINGATTTGMGGISAGTGGAGGTKAGAAGNVSHIVADAIASIVAGRVGVGDAFTASNLATKVDGIILNGTTGISTAQSFTLTFDGQTTPALSSTDTTLQVATALNALSTIASAGGVTVTATAGSYIVTFNNTGTRDAIVGTETVPWLTAEQVQGNATTEEVQNIQVVTQGPGVAGVAGSTFTLTYNGQTTGVLTLDGDSSADLTQDALNVQKALDGLSNIPAGGVTVTETAATATSYPVFQVTFNSDGAQPLIVQNALATVVDASSASTAAVETITLPSNTSINPALLATPNFVGSIYNPAREFATTFSFTVPPSTTPVVATQSTPFQFGDSPLDGLIAALDLTSFKNFVPQAYVTEDASGNAVLLNNVNG